MVVVTTHSPCASEAQGIWSLSPAAAAAAAADNDGGGSLVAGLYDTSVCWPEIDPRKLTEQHLNLRVGFSLP